MYDGEDVLPFARSKLGQAYKYGSGVVLSNPHHNGPWDCADFASWCAYQAYGIIFGAYGNDPFTAEPYSGKWFDDALDAATFISVGEALYTPGAFLVRRPGETVSDGHVAVCVGDGSIYEAHSELKGVRADYQPQERYWSTGVLIPGVRYNHGVGEYTQPSRILRIEQGFPFLRGDDVRVVQYALKAKRFDPGRVDGIYGHATVTAVHNFQAVVGLKIDGEVGAETATALGVGWPINTGLLADYVESGENRYADGPAHALAHMEAEDAEGEFLPVPDAVVPMPVPRPQSIDLAIVERRGAFSARDTRGMEFFIGRKTRYRQRGRVYNGLYQTPQSDTALLIGGRYDRDEARPDLGVWADLLYPTIEAESGGYFCRLNSYDRARFTFGCYQFAAHTPNDNLIALFKVLSVLPEFESVFPDLSIRGNRLHAFHVDGFMVDLEVEERGELRAFMEYLNPRTDRIDEEEARNAARLMYLTEHAPEARTAQIHLAQALARRNLSLASRKGVPLVGRPLPQVIWVNDALHQGRAKYTELTDALNGPDPEHALRRVGLSHRYPGRIATVAKAIEVIMGDPAAGRLRYGVDIV